MEDSVFKRTLLAFALDDFSTSIDLELHSWLQATPHLIFSSPVTDGIDNQTAESNNDDNNEKRENTNDMATNRSTALLKRWDSDPSYIPLSKRLHLLLREENDDSIDTISPKALPRPSPRARNKIQMPLSSSPRTKRRNKKATSGEPCSFSGLAPGTSGEHRIRIKFESFGQVTDTPQRFGKSGCVIPHELMGTHDMYEQHWRFEVLHNMPESILPPNRAASPLTVVPITWRITNVTSGMTVELTETPQQALVRQMNGRTVCNRVVKMALNARSRDLEQWFEANSGAMDAVTRLNTLNSIRLLQPRLCTVGLLFFGLLHDTVQMECARMISGV